MDNQLLEDAERIEGLLPALMRRLFPTETDHPVAELSIAQRRVCTILQAGPRPLSSLGDELGISPSATTQIADRLERAHMVERIEDPDDRRVRMLRLTTCGAEMMHTRRRARVHQVSRALERLDPAARKSVLCALNALLEASAGAATEKPSDKPER